MKHRRFRLTLGLLLLAGLALTPSALKAAVAAREAAPLFDTRAIDVNPIISNSPNDLLSSAPGQPATSVAISATGNYLLTQRVIASAGDVRVSLHYQLSDTTGQSAASGATTFSSAHYLMSSGFWATITTKVYLPVMLK